MKPQTRKLFAVQNLLIFMIAATLSGCSQNAEAEKPKGPPEAMAVSVVGFKTEQRDITDSIFMVGTLEANESVDIKSEINGTIDKINFTEGQRVNQGDLLVQIDQKKLQAAYDQAVANLKLAETTARRYETLVKGKAVSQQEYDEVVATLDSNRASVQFAEEQLDEATIRAPFEGYMGERLVSVGQFIVQGTQISSLFNKDPVKATFHVPERYLGEVKQGQTLRMNVAAYPDKTYEGEVYFIAPKIDEMTRTAQVKAYVPNPDGELFEGMFANINLIVRLQNDALVVPETALIIKGDDVLVYVVKDDDTVEMRPVKTGKRFEGMVLIQDGLAKDETVVTEGYQKIGPGSKVKVRFEEASGINFNEII